jgi:vacuolar protein sorting-associated protein 72
MATNRPQRANAGRNISKLLEQEEIGDEFYQTAYGGFQELSEDEEYKSEEEADDVVDSDFDLSEKEESEKEDIPEPKAKKRKWLKVVKPKPSTIYEPSTLYVIYYFLGIK